MFDEGITPVLPVGNTNNDGMFGGSGGGFIWILLIFMLLGGGGGLFGGANAATNQVNNDFLYTQSKIDALGQANITQTTQLNQTMNAGFNGVNMGLCNLGHQIDSGFCTTNRNIDSVKFQMSQDKCDITNAIGASTQTLMSYLTSQEIANWRERALAAETRENNAAQTATIVGRLQPSPQPAYLTAPPNAPFYGAAPYVPFAPAPFVSYGGGGYDCHRPCACPC